MRRMARLLDHAKAQRGKGRKARRKPRRMIVERLEVRQVLDGVIISEFLALNDPVGGADQCNLPTCIKDEDGETSDWIELLNTGDVEVDLDGWHITDNADDLNK